jgi:hypothetical protein
VGGRRWVAPEGSLEATLRRSVRLACIPSSLSRRAATVLAAAAAVLATSFLVVGPLTDESEAQLPTGCKAVADLHLLKGKRLDLDSTVKCGDGVEYMKITAQIVVKKFFWWNNHHSRQVEVERGGEYSIMNLRKLCKKGERKYRGQVTVNAITRFNERFTVTHKSKDLECKR